MKYYIADADDLKELTSFTLTKGQTHTATQPVVGGSEVGGRTRKEPDTFYMAPPCSLKPGHPATIVDELFNAYQCQVIGIGVTNNRAGVVGFVIEQSQITTDNEPAVRQKMKDAAKA